MSCLFSELRGQELRWNLSVGDRLGVILNQHKVSTTRVDKREVRIDSSTTIHQGWEVVAIDESGNFEIQQSIEAIKVRVANPEFPSQSLAFDTTSETWPSKESANILKQVLPLIGLQFKVTMSPRGEIKAVTSSEETTTQLQELPGSLDLQSLFTEKGLKEMLGGTVLVFPAQSSKEGDRWETKNIVVNPLGVFERVTQHQYAKTEKVNDAQIAVVELASTIEAKKLVDEKEGKLNSYEESGELRFDLVNGFVRSAKTHSLTEVETWYGETGLVTTVDSTNTVSIEAR
jgi:hypothetical protein